jgi:hypothetical protein
MGVRLVQENGICFVSVVQAGEGLEGGFGDGTSRSGWVDGMGFSTDQLSDVSVLRPASWKEPQASRWSAAAVGSGDDAAAE